MAMSKSQISQALDIGQEFLFLDEFHINSMDDLMNQNSGSKEKTNLAVSGGGGVGSYIFLPTPSLSAHFLSKQIVPASLILESILQNTVLTIYTHFSIPKGVHALIFKIEMDLKNSVQLNEQIKIVSKIENISRGIISATAETHSESKLISKANLKYWCPEADSRN